MKKTFLAFLLIILCWTSFAHLYAQEEKKGRGGHERPFFVGPQYPLSWLRTRFEPDSAFLLETGNFTASYDYILSNHWGYSGNNERFKSEGSGESKEFRSQTYDGYSVYLDGETAERIYRFHLGLFDVMELQFAFRELRFTPGNLDGAIETFHKTIQVGNEGREITGRNQFEIYVWDNDKEEMVFQLSDPKSGYIDEASTLGLKFLLNSTENEALSLRISSNFKDRYIETELNEVDASNDVTRSHHDFNDYNIALHYSTIFPSMSIHLAAATTIMENKIFAESPKQLFYYFTGFNFHFFESIDILLQDLRYSSIYPKNAQSNLGGDVNELTLGFRLYFFPEAVLDFGFVENYSFGPHNIDIAFFSNFVLSL